MKFINAFVKFIAIKGVNFYRKFISPYKGFKCAHAHYAGSQTCSTYGLKQLQTQENTMEAVRLIFHRLNACSHVTHLFNPHPPAKRQNSLGNKQGGFVDCDCGDVSHCDVPHCDLPDCKVPHCKMPHCGIGDVFDVCDCDIFDFKKNKNKENLHGNKNVKSNNIVNKNNKRKGSTILPNFQLIDELDNNYLLYQYNLTDEYYKIHKDCIDCDVEDILKNNTSPVTEKLAAEEVIKLLTNKKKINLEKK